MARINIESPMLAVLDENGYLPAFKGRDMLPEYCDPSTSLANLRGLLRDGLRIASMSVLENNHVLFVFETGETYLATGFSVGTESETTHAFAAILHEIYGGSLSGWIAKLTCGFDDTFRGVITAKTFGPAET